MAERFLKFIPSAAAMKLAIYHKNAFILLLIIAERARRCNGDPDGLTIGQCHLGNHKSYGMTEKEYRYAKQILVNNGLIKIVETCRTRKKGPTHSLFLKSQNVATERATRVTTKGTLVELCNSMVWDINSDTQNHPKGDRKGESRATEGRPKGEEQEREEGISNDIQEKAQTAARLRSKDVLSFDFVKWEFSGIAEKDIADWKVMYPHINLQVETLKAAQWLKNNQSKSSKKSFRKYLTGWFGRANDSIENKKAYRSAAGSTGQDRRTKDIHGNPVDSPHDGKF